MKTIRMILLALLVFIIPLITASCWNYREIDKLGVVAGVAIDRGKDGKYKITVEIVEVSGGKDSKTESRIITAEGKTIFDAVRNGISLSGKRLYWSHTKVVIISRQLAVDGVIQVLDWFNRDAETRADFHILVSKGESAKEVLEIGEKNEDVKSFDLEYMIENQRSLSKAPQTEIWEFTNELAAQGVAAVVPAIELYKTNGKVVPRIMGTAIFKEDKLLGFIDGEETKDMLFIQNEIKGGLLIEQEDGAEDAMPSVSLEVFNSKTKVEPTILQDGSIQMNINTETIVAIDEIGGSENVIDEEGRKKLEQSAEETLKTRIESLIKKVQSEYGADIFGFGAKLREDKPKVWAGVENRWEDIFKNLQVKVTTKVHIRNSAMMAKPLEVGD
ncbi:MAG: Ger(x)C family spore germination protein [Clostridia bacterium]|nr:Ger(x)C family spore germination protein [Clostridia bacterium]